MSFHEAHTCPWQDIAYHSIVSRHLSRYDNAKSVRSILRLNRQKYIRTSIRLFTGKELFEGKTYKQALYPLMLRGTPWMKYQVNYVFALGQELKSSRYPGYCWFLNSKYTIPLRKWMVQMTTKYNFCELWNFIIDERQRRRDPCCTAGPLKRVSWCPDPSTS